MRNAEMSFDELDRFVKERGGKSFHHNNFAAYNGMKIEYAEDDMAILSLTVNEHSLNYKNAVQGGLLFALGDGTAGSAVRTVPGSYVTLDGNINYIGNVGLGHRIYSCGDIVHRGKTTIICEVYIVSDENKVIARARYTFFKTGEKPDNLPPDNKNENQ